MNNFKRHTYKTKNPPKPTRIAPSLSWFVSEAQAVPPSTNYCLPIDTQVYRLPDDSTPLASDGTQSLYKDPSFTTPLYDGVKQNTYTIDNQAKTANDLAGQTDIVSVTTNAFGKITNIDQGDCNPNVNLASFFITEVSANGADPCQRVSLSYEVKVNTNDLDALNALTSGQQLYSVNSTNSNLIPLDPTIIPNTILSGFQNGQENKTGASYETSNVGDNPAFSYTINENGVVSNKQACTATNFSFTFTDGSTVYSVTNTPSFVYVDVQSDGAWTISLADISSFDNEFTDSGSSTLSGSGNQSNIQIKIENFDSSQNAIQVNNNVNGDNLTINNST